MTNQNLPCPFCGYEVLDFATTSIIHPKKSCCLTSTLYNKAQWNSRPPHPLEAKVAEFREYAKLDSGVVGILFNKFFGEENKE